MTPADEARDDSEMTIAEIIEIKAERERRTAGLTESVDRAAHLSRDTGIVLGDRRIGAGR